MDRKTWLITGISSGLGRVMAERLLARGDRVAGTVRDLASSAVLQARYGDQIWIASLDLTETARIRGTVDAAFANFGTIDVVVNNAGYGLFGAAEEVTDEQILHQISTNLLGSMQVVRSALPHLRKKGGGRIIQVSSMAGQITFAGGAIYQASKWGIEGFIEAVAKELGGFNIGCTIIEPGAIQTDFRMRSSKLATPIAAYDQSAARWLNAALSDENRRSTGDPGKMADVIIASADQEPAPERLALGSDAYEKIHEALSRRLAILEAQRELATSTDFST